MVKFNLIIASVAVVVCSVSAQDQIPTAIPSGAIPSGVSIPAIPTEFAAIFSSVMQNPSGLQSYISMASAKVSQLPSQLQSSAYNALSEASKTLNDVKPKNTAQASTKSLGNTAQIPSHYFAALAISIIVAVIVV